MFASGRIFERLPLSLPVEYEDFERFRPDRIVNLSAGGVFIVSTKPFALKQMIRLRFVLPEFAGKPFRTTGWIVWTPLQAKTSTGSRHPMGMGVEFEMMDRELFRLLDQYVATLAALRNLDTRIGDELPAHIRTLLPIPNGKPFDYALDE